MRYFILVATALLICVSLLQAQDSTETNENRDSRKQVFVDDDGDGYNDNAPDHDNDGIPNGLDPDWIKMQKEEKKREARRFIDLNGDGIDDNLQKGEQIKQSDSNEMNKNASSMEQDNKQQRGQRRQNQNGKK